VTHWDAKPKEDTVGRFYRKEIASAVSDGGGKAKRYLHLLAKPSSLLTCDEKPIRRG
jgi:hypothetical protein